MKPGRKFGPHPSGPHPSSPHPSNPLPFEPTKTLTLAKVGLAKLGRPKGLAKVGLAKVGLAKVGHDRFLTVVEVGQYFMTKDTEEFSQFTDAVACREYILPRNEDTSEPKGWIRVNTKTGPVLKVTTCSLQGKYGVEIRIMSVNKDNSHSWVRISHDLNKFDTNLNNNEQETSEMQFEEYALRLNASDFASRSKAKAEPQKRDFASSSTRKRIWTVVEPRKQSLSDYFFSVEEIDPSSSSWRPT